MDKYSIRVNNAKKDMQKMEGSMWEIATNLWQNGYSIRVIEEVCGISRSKLQRFFSENTLEKTDDIRTQNRNRRVNYARKLHKMGFTDTEIAQELHVSIRTVESYLRQVGVKKSTNFGD